MFILRLLSRLIGWTTLISLLFWGWLAWSIVNEQPQTPPPPGYPANVAECRARWAQPIAYPEVRAEALRQCDRYYALLGDRSAPFLARLREQVVTRLSSLIIMEYLQNHTTEPGEVITGQTVVAALGTRRIGELLLHTITNASDPYLTPDMAEGRCRLDEVRRIQSSYDLSMLPLTCQKPR